MHHVPGGPVRRGHAGAAPARSLGYKRQFHPGKIPNNFLASRNYGDEINMKTRGVGYKSFKTLRRNA
ncbi:hypothetical protein ALC53_07330 [Atta colombica]|uniref:Uncharacterized protein n=1 Tax=Atta colombica TaxID=520822 RepID=A0A195BDP4_9HYME|nr:hypothetical protein ALC53_07330 [Atta colombica]